MKHAKIFAKNTYNPMNSDEHQIFWPLMVFALSFLAYHGYRIYRIYRNYQAKCRYEKTAYYLITRNSYSSIFNYDGRYTEYLTYEYLRQFENTGGKFLFNLIIPKMNGGTTEIDVLLICSKGLFVFECKDFGGWIFGNEAQKYWTQTLPSSIYHHNKERFYNPIMQNASHIKHLRPLVGESATIFSIIVFSERCTLMDIEVRDSNVPVVNICEVPDIVGSICSITKRDAYSVMEINYIYNKLYEYTQHTPEIRANHILGINRSFYKRQY